MNPELKNWHVQQGATWKEESLLHYGNPLEEMKATEKGVGVFAGNAEGVLLVRGPDAGVFLSGISANHVSGLPEGQAMASLFCATKGKIQHDVLVYRLKNEEFLILPQEEALDLAASYMTHYHIREDLEMGQVPFVPVILTGASLEGVLAGMGLPLGGNTTFSEAPLLVASLPLGAMPRVFLFAPAPHVPALVEKALGAGATLMGSEALEEARIWARVPRFGVDFTTDHLPAEAALYDHIAFNQGCYIGQEIHARMHYRGHPNRKLCAVKIPEIPETPAVKGSTIPAIGTELFAGGEQRGELKSLSQTARNGFRMGIAEVRYKVLEESLPVSLGAEEGAALELLALATDMATDLAPKIQAGKDS